MFPEKPLKICQLLHSLNVGGAEILATSLVQNLPKERFQFVFFCLDEAGSRAELLREAGFTVEVLNRKPGFDYACMRKIRELWKRYEIQIVHAHQYTPFFYALGARGLGGAQPPLIFTEHGRFFPDFPSWKHKIFNSVLIRPRDRVTAVGRSVAQAVVRNEGIPANRVSVIYNGIDGSKFAQPAQNSHLRESLGLGNRKIILFTARLDPIKDHPTALRAMRLLMDRVGNSREDAPILLLAGGGPEFEHLRNLTQELKLENNVRLLGERGDVADLLGIANVFLLTSVSEGIPLTILEAMAARVPVVATNVGGIPEILEPGVSGLLADSGDAPALSCHMFRLLSDSNFARTLSEAAHAQFEARFTLSTMLTQYENLFLTITNGNL